MLFSIVQCGAVTTGTRVSASERLPWPRRPDGDGRDVLSGQTGRRLAERAAVRGTRSCPRKGAQPIADEADVRGTALIGRREGTSRSPISTTLWRGLAPSGEKRGSVALQESISCDECCGAATTGKVARTGFGSGNDGRTCPVRTGANDGARDAKGGGITGRVEPRRRSAIQRPRRSSWHTCSQSLMRADKALWRLARRLRRDSRYDSTASCEQTSR